jgi:DNA-binding transcriptional ArsR family regulator
MGKSTLVFPALADPIRREILVSLRKEGRTAGEIAAQFKVSWPAVSRHLRVLKAAGLVWETKEGRTRYYEINLPAVQPVLAWLDQFRPEPVVRAAPSPLSAAASAGREYSS